MAIFCHSPPERSRPLDELLARAAGRSCSGSLSITVVGEALLGGASAMRGRSLAASMRPTPMLSRRGELIAEEILEDDADMRRGDPSSAKSRISMPSISDAALVGVVEPGHQLDDGGLAGAVLADQRQASRRR